MQSHRRRGLYCIAHTMHKCMSRLIIYFVCDMSFFLSFHFEAAFVYRNFLSLFCLSLSIFHVICIENTKFFLHLALAESLILALFTEYHMIITLDLNRRVFFLNIEYVFAVWHCVAQNVQISKLDSEKRRLTLWNPHSFINCIVNIPHETHSDFDCKIWIRIHEIMIELKINFIPLVCVNLRET